MCLLMKSFKLFYVIMVDKRLNDINIDDGRVNCNRITGNSNRQLAPGNQKAHKNYKK